MVDVTTGESYGFTLAGGNWTSASLDALQIGEAILLSVDPPLVEGSLEANGPALGPGVWNVTIG